MACSKSSGKSDLLSRVQMREERHLIDRLREIRLDQYIELPQIAVMGDTSSGKSSLLSALSRVSLSSSDQLTTRCPTQLIISQGDTFQGNIRLMRYHSSENQSVDGASGKNRQELCAMDGMPVAIERSTKKLIAEGQYISDDQIVIKMCGPDLPNLTLTDLPGLVRTVGDNEDQSIIQRVRQLVDRYMTQERTITIAVVSANVDMHNTEILQTAKEADLKEVRTIAVVTNLDLVDVLVPRGRQRDLNNDASIRDGLLNEKSFFGGHEYWRRLPQHIWGMYPLSKRLVIILQDNTRRSLTKVIQDINSRVEKAQSKLKELGEMLDTESSRRHQFGKWVNIYLRHMEAAINGNYDKLPNAVCPSRASPSDSGDIGGTVDLRLRAGICREELGFQKSITATKSKVTPDTREQSEVQVGDTVKVGGSGPWYTVQVTEHDDGEIRCAEFGDHWFSSCEWKYKKYHKIKQLIEENQDDELALFAPYRVFCHLLQNVVEAWRDPTLEPVKSYRHQVKLISDTISEKLHALMRVEQFIENTATRVLARLTDDAERQVSALLSGKRRPYTQDESLFQEVGRRRQERLKAEFESLLPRSGSNTVPSNNMMRLFTKLTTSSEAVEMEIALQAYCEIACRRYVNAISMRLNEFVLTKFLQEMEEELLGTTDAKLAKLMQNSTSKVAERKQLVNELECLKNAKEEFDLVAGQ